MKPRVLKPSGGATAPLGSALGGTPSVFAAAPTERVRGRAGVERRKRWLSLHPLCAECDKRGRTEAGTAVDHVVPLAAGGPDTDANKQTLCDPCHTVKTRTDVALLRSLGLLKEFPRV